MGLDLEMERQQVVVVSSKASVGGNSRRFPHPADANALVRNPPSGSHRPPSSASTLYIFV